MSEEEKKAIEYWQYIRDTQIYDGYKGHVYSVVLLNLINKQQKEIEELNAEILELTNQRTEGFWENDRLKKEIEEYMNKIDKEL